MFCTKCYQVRTTFSEGQFFQFFDILELNYTLTYALHDFRDLSLVYCLLDNILLAQLQKSSNSN